MINYSKCEAEISVIVPVYNIVAENLKSTIDSIINQSFENFELLIIDDGSRDDCSIQCDQLGEKDSRIKVIHKSNGGVSSARNVGIEVSKGKYIAFIDAGDVVDRNYLEILYDSLMDSDAEVVVCGCQFISDAIFYKGQDDLSESKIVNNIDAIYDLCYMHHPYKCIEVTAVWGSLFRKMAIENIRFNEKMVIGEDFDFKFKVYCQLNTVAYINAPIYGYIELDGSAIRSKFLDKHYETFKEFKKLLEEYKGDKLIKAALQCRVINMDILFLIRSQNEEKRIKDIEAHIKQNRKSVLLNSKARLKVKTSLVLSFLGFQSMKNIYDYFK